MPSFFSHYPKAKICTVAAAKVVKEATEAKLILATGGPGMVKAAYFSGHLSLGVGAGNTPAVIDASADIPMVVSSILLSKAPNNGMICASEQAVVVDAIDEQVKAEFQRL